MFRAERLPSPLFRDQIVGIQFVLRVQGWSGLIRKLFIAIAVFSVLGRVCPSIFMHSDLVEPQRQKRVRFAGQSRTLTW